MTSDTTTSAPATAPTLAPASPTPSDATEAEGLLIVTPVAQDGDDAIRPFAFRASDDDLADLDRRIEATRWSERELVDDGTQGVQLAFMREVARYWATDYDWRRCEAQLNGTRFASARDLADSMRRAAAAHGEHEARMGGQYDENWPDWYAAHMMAEQAGTPLPQ